jgi:hypothetical protein
MTQGLRWRIFVLQVGLIGILAFCSGFLFWGSSFVGGQVHDELTQQQIFFPAAGSQGFSAQEFPTLQQYAGQQLTTGDQAKAYANDYINVHLQSVAGGQTYAQVSTKALADPTNTKLAAQKTTLFQGETLRGLLLNAYGWATVGTYAFYAAIGLAVAAFAVLLAFVYELFYATRKATEKVVVAPLGAPIPSA